MRILSTRLLGVAISAMLYGGSAPAIAAHLEKPPLPLKKDGCSYVPDFDFGACCDTHDKPYWRGGTAEQRKEADSKFRACIRAKGHEILDDIYYFGVRLGGVPWLPTSFRWGFGWRFEKGHRGYVKKEQ